MTERRSVTRTGAGAPRERSQDVGRCWRWAMGLPRRRRVAGIYASYQGLEETSGNEGAFFRVRGEPNSVKNLREQFSHVL